MKQYPSIPYWSQKMIGESCICFDKKDGSNLRFEFNRKSGWCKAGTRNQMIDKTNEQFGAAIPLFLDKYGDELAKVFSTKPYRNKPNFVAFCEWLGPNSFAGQHDKNDKMDLILFDISEYKRGMILPKEFVENFGHLHIPEIIYQGILTEDFINDVKYGKYILNEGVMAKGSHKTKGGEQVWIAKIKTKAWVDKVKSIYGAEWVKKELNGDQNLIADFNI